MTSIKDTLTRANQAAYREHGVSFDASSMQAFTRAVEQNQAQIASGDFSGALALMLANLKAEIPPDQKRVAVDLLTSMKQELADGTGATTRPRTRGLTSASDGVLAQMPKLFEQLLAAYTGGARPSSSTAGTVPFKPDAGEQWYPALDKASDYARSLGYDGVRHEGTGMRVRGLGRPPVDAIELQAIKLLKSDGSEVALGSILPEQGHLQSLKSTDSLVAEMKALIDQHHAGGASPSRPTVTPGAHVPTPGGASALGSISSAVDAVPSAISAVYDVSLSSDQKQLTIDPAPRRPMMRTRGATRSVGVVSTRTELGGRHLALQTKDAGGDWKVAKFDKGEWRQTSFADAIEQSIRSHHADKGEREIKALVADARDKVAAAGYGLDVPRDILVVTAKGDDSPIFLVMSKDADRPGCVSVCSEVTVMDFDPDSPPQLMVRKPVVYFYPTAKTELHVEVRLGDRFAAQYPKANDGDGAWRFIATPDGVLFDPTTERRFSYLFWEGRARDFALDEGRAHCVPGSDAAAFLEKVAFAYQLSDKERTDFVTYWLPALEQNRFNLVQLLDAEEYGRYAQMKIEPQPDTVIRLFMIFRGSDARVATGAPALPSFTRKGFTVVEWGGVNLDERV